MTNGRNQNIWQTAYHDRRLPEKMLTVPFPYIEVHLQDAERLGLQAGDIASIYNEEGNGTFPVYLTEAVRPGMVWIMQYHAQGTSNSMTSPYTDPKTTIPWYKGTRVGIRKAVGSLESLKRTTSFRRHNDFS